ncbi:putative inactive receptor kinase [Apostasia shenzhenica]|uniref:Putative inactive receptor kinase n=1 Tax=Apostasia shenzhenica TaxID=1088818 RepID=A0A2I0BFT0_9ASPA|nr:putative inactive receptor kinase [Apostasia shenzhenica]
MTAVHVATVRTPQALKSDCCIICSTALGGRMQASNDQEEIRLGPCLARGPKQDQNTVWAGSLVGIKQNSYVSYTSLYIGRRGEDRADLDWEARLKIALGAAAGIAHIHAQSNGRLAHGNINSSNVFLNEQHYGCSVVREEWTGEVFDVQLMGNADVEEEMVEMLKIAMLCVARVQETRPKMSQVVKMISDEFFNRIVILVKEKLRCSSAQTSLD